MGNMNLKIPRLLHRQDEEPDHGSDADPRADENKGLPRGGDGVWKKASKQEPENRL